MAADTTAAPTEASPWRLAKHVRVEQDGIGAVRVYIDGELFPYYTASEPKVIQVGRKRLPSITLEVVAENLEVDCHSGMRA